MTVCSLVRRKSMSMHIRELISLAEMESVYPVLAQMYPKMTEAEYKTLIADRIHSGYRMLGVFKDDVCICSAGFWIGVRFYCGKFIQLDNMVTDQAHRSVGAGKLVVDWIKDLARKEGC